MSTVTYAPPLTGVPAPTKPSLPLLVSVEIRKLVDTRSGRWLVAAILLLSVAVNVLMLAFSPDDSLRAAQLLQITLVPSSLLLPVLGILTVTTEWSQRTALTTFSLVPSRGRVVAAKLIAATGWALVTVVFAIAVALVATALVNAFDLGSGDYTLTAGALGGSVLNQIIGTLLGVGFGLALLNTPFAIVLFFVLPTASSIVSETVPRIAEAWHWFDINWATSPLLDGHMTGELWGQVVVAGSIWVLLPIAFGTWRVLHREIA
ncbi:ABC transporter permease [Spongisporangium articulatum]|uniref:ABC transporter permease n=1 Tax=Spongisporangium articulatum TaxID=3362603 RepID=A0ABW8AKS4_9ACTN